MTLFKRRTNTKQSLDLILMVILSLLLLFGCSKEGKDDKTVSAGETDTSPVVARVGDGGITVSEFQSYLFDRPMPQRYPVSREALEKRLDEMVLEEVLYQEALRLKLDQDPDVRRRMRQMLTQKLIDEQINRQVWDKELEEFELQEYYDSHWDEFNRPEQVRLADIFIAVPDEASDEEIAELRKKAESVLAEAKAAKNQRMGFGNLVRKYSDKPAKYRKGDTGFFNADGQPIGIADSLAAAAFELERVGEMAEHVIESPDGYHVIMLIGKRSAVHKPLKAVRRQLEQRIRREAIARERDAYLENLKANAEVQVDRQAVSAVLEELNSTARSEQLVSKSKKASAQRGSGQIPVPFQGKQN